MRRLLAASALAVAVLAAPALATYPKGSEAEQTHPRVTPKRGHRHTDFSVRFTLASSPGQHGVSKTDYRIQVTAPKSARSACTPPQPAAVTDGTQGDRVKVALPQPDRGWCRG